MDVAQSLLSRQLSQLEEEWGDRLFERTGRGVVLTDFGRRLQPEIDLLVGQAERLETSVKESAGMLVGTVHIGVLPSMSRQLIPNLYEKVRALAPSVRLHITEGFSGDLDVQLGSGRLDMIIVNRYGLGAGRDEDILGTVDTFLVGKRGSLPSAEHRIAFSELAGLPLVLPSTPNGLRSTLDHLAREQRIALTLAMEVDTLSAMKDVAQRGNAFTILPYSAVDEECRLGKLVALRIDGPAIKRTIALGFSKQRPLSRAARACGQWLRELATQDIERQDRDGN